MATFKSRIINAHIEDIASVEEKIRTKFQAAALRNFKEEVKPVIDDMVNRAVTASKENFQPHKQGGDELVGKLGVGRDGEPLTDKLNNAWKILLIGNEGSVVKSSLILKKGNKFGQYQYKIDRDAFYDAGKTNYLSVQAKEFGRIPWMKHFLRGMPTIPGFRFVGVVDRGFNEDKSRTGLGHMGKTKIPSRQFSLQGYGEQKAFGAIQDAINSRVRRGTFKSELKDSMKKAFRKGN